MSGAESNTGQEQKYDAFHSTCLRDRIGGKSIPRFLFLNDE